MKIETLPTTDLIPYARNTRTHSPEQGKCLSAKINARSTRAGQHGNAVRKRKLFGVCNKITNRNEISVNHVMVIRAKGDKVFHIITPSFFSRDNVVNSSNMVESTKHTSSAVSHSCCHFSTPPCIHFWNSSERDLMAFFRTILGAKAQTLVAQHGRRDIDKVSANLAGVSFSFVKWVFDSCALASKLIAAFFGTILSFLNVRHGLKRFLAVLTLVNSRRFSSPSPVVATDKHFPVVYNSAATAFAFA